MQEGHNNYFWFYFWLAEKWQECAFFKLEPKQTQITFDTQIIENRSMISPLDI